MLLAWGSAPSPGETSSWLSRVAFTRLLVKQDSRVGLSFQAWPWTVKKMLSLAQVSRRFQTLRSQYQVLPKPPSVQVAAHFKTT